MQSLDVVLKYIPTVLIHSMLMKWFQGYSCEHNISGNYIWNEGYGKTMNDVF